MVDSQIRPHRILKQALLRALEMVPRELFLPPHLHAVAYADCDLPYHDHRFLMAPKVFAQLVESAEIDPSLRILVLGCGSGYSLAVLSRLCRHVVGVESIPSLVQQARCHMDTLQLPSVSLIEGPLAEGQLGGMFDVILIEGAVADIPPSLKEQLSDDKGRLVTIKQGEVLGRGIVLSRYRDTFTCREIFDAHAHALPEFASQKAAFIF